VTEQPSNFRPLIAAGILLGAGLGGFFDGILFHQVLQIHNMLSSSLPKTSIENVEVNMFWDGLFHVFTWLTTAAGLALLWRAGKHAEVPWSTRAFAGSLLAGWGLFNFIEGLVNHYMLGIHHVVERFGLSIYDHAFIASGVLLSFAGYRLIRTGQKQDVEHVLHPGMQRKHA
jgi:uncharacterized membrane protein